MIDKFSLALTLMREAFEDARAGAMFMPSVDLAAEVDGAQQVMNAAAAVQAVRVAQYAARTLEQCRADALVDLMLTNVTVATTVRWGHLPLAGA